MSGCAVIQALPPLDGINVTDSVTCVSLNSNRSAHTKPATPIGYVLDESSIFRRLRRPFRCVTFLLNGKDLTPLCVLHPSEAAKLAAKG